MARTKHTPARRSPKAIRPAAKRNQLDQLGLVRVDYKDTATLRTFLSERGKIRSRAVTGLTVQQQRMVTTAIKNAREMALLPYSSHRGGSAQGRRE